jgi:hypothetical protein
VSRGLVIPLTPEQVVTRALYLAGERTIHDLDEHVLLRTDTPEYCPVIFYRLNGKHDGLPAYNGGKDPRATDPADRWTKPGKTFVNVTCDCMGGAAWCAGFDRYQPKRMPASIGYGGWYNTDSMLLDARGPARCFIELAKPEPGTMITCASGTPGHEVGHVGTVVGYRLAEWDPTSRECWEAIEVVDIAARRDRRGMPARANMRTTGRGWFGTGAGFLRSVMMP